MAGKKASPASTTKKIASKAGKTGKKAGKTAAVAKKTTAKPKKEALKTTKTSAKKTVETAAAVVEVKKESKKPQKPSSLKIEVYDPDGKKDGSLDLPEALFGAKINKVLIAQAIRVYLANQREGSAVVKTRGMVQGSTRKIYRQKGTGRARHGAIRAPIFVGGGVTFGPVKRDFSLSLPKKMKKAALSSALTRQYQEGAVKVVNKLETLPLKTKAFHGMFLALSCTGKTVLYLSKKEQNMVRAVRNLTDVDTHPVSDATTYTVMTHTNVVFTKPAISELEERMSEHHA